MSTYKILIADDHEMMREGIKNLIRQNEELNIVGEASAGREAVDLFNSLKPDLLILDISMPDMNGMEVSKAILSAHPQAKIIIFSMYNDQDYISKCLEFGVKGFVIKSDSGEELQSAIVSVLNGKQHFSRQVQDVIFKKYTNDVSRKKEPVSNLTKREVEIIKLIAEGLTSQQMADKLFISTRTVETHRANLMKKVAAKNAIELIKRVQELNLI